jgi:hypothetical protein
MRITDHIATSDPEYTPEELEFLKDLEAYRKEVLKGKKFPGPVETFRLLKHQGRIIGKAEAAGEVEDPVPFRRPSAEIRYEAEEDFDDWSV